MPPPPPRHQPANDGTNHHQLSNGHSSPSHQALSNPQTTQPNPATTQVPSAVVAALFLERRHRLATDKATKEALETAKRKEKAANRKATISANPESALAKQAKHAQEVEKERKEDQLARNAVLAKIEKDKIQRKERAAEEKLARDTRGEE